MYNEQLEAFPHKNLYLTQVIMIDILSNQLFYENFRA